jgi:hypothetical protein
MMMGDLVLLPIEVMNVMNRLEAGGFVITALHNHLLFENPRIMYMHYMAHGNAETLSKTLKAALLTTGTPLDSSSLPPRKKTTRGQGPLPVALIGRILARQGSTQGEILSFGFPRAEIIRENGMEIPPFMGIASTINFQSAPGGVAATGDFVLLSSEVNPVLQALQSSGIQVTALHNHMLDESPRLFFMHFWGQGPAETVATGLRKALNRINLKQ